VNPGHGAYLSGCAFINAAYPLFPIGCKNGHRSYVSACRGMCRHDGRSQQSAPCFYSLPNRRTAFHSQKFHWPMGYLVNMPRCRFIERDALGRRPKKQQNPDGIGGTQVRGRSFQANTHSGSSRPALGAIYLGKLHANLPRRSSTSRKFDPRNPDAKKITEEVRWT
jgi:hypothetical protein